jgi:hypothetical protein
VGTRLSSGLSEKQERKRKNCQMETRQSQFYRACGS